MGNNEKIFAFDIGTGSIGTCVRQDKEILHLGVDRLPSDYASLGNARLRRRQIRTRMAHKKREEWWKQQAKLAGIEVPETGHLDEKGNFVKPDDRMSREFPKDGDSTIYNSALLRIALLQGKKLEGWQIFKAIWSAIQHRGYDANTKWVRLHKRNIDEEDEINEGNKIDSDEKASIEAVKKYNNELEKIFENKEEFHYPCYYEAYKMGIWDPSDPENLSKKISHNPSPVRNKDGKIDIVIPRELVEKEIRKMLDQAGEKYPYIKENLDYILYGPGKKMYAALEDRKYRKYLGKDWETQGLLSQKTPRFDNRIISKCILMPRFNVCKAKDQLNKEVTFLMKLKNMRYFLKDGGEEKSLTPNEIKDIFEKFKEKLSIGKKEWKKYLNEKNAIVNPSQVNVEATKIKGRSRFCRPALKILKEILLSGKSPHAYREELLKENNNTDPKKGLVVKDYDFLLKMPIEWDKFCIPDERADDENLEEEKRAEKIEKIISSITNPIVKHRLGIFHNKLKEMEKRFGKPDKVIVEFVRHHEEGFMGELKKKAFMEKQKENKKGRDSAFEKVKELGLKGGEALLKVQLHQDQGWIDVYDGKTIKETEIGNYEIDHIVPRENGGPDSYINKVLTSRQNNQEKGKKTPYEWLKEKPEEWKEYINRIKSFDKMDEKKKELLTSADALTLVNKYTQLAETAYIAKLSQKIACLHFDWPQLTKGSERRFFVSNGGQTAKMRRIYKLNRLLHTNLSDEEYKELEHSSDGKNNIDEKNRDNPRHHALDAMVISMLPEIKMNDRKKDFYPVWFNSDYCKKELEKCFPKNIRYEKPVLAETVYGLRKINGKDEYVFVTRYVGDVKNISGYYDIKNANKYLDKIFSPKIHKDFKEKLDTKPTAEEWKQFLDNYFAGGKPKKILLKDSRVMKGNEVRDFLNGKIKNLDEFIKGKMPGQYLKQKQDSYGYFVYKNDKGKWIRETIYAFESPYKKGKDIRDKHKDAYYFRSGMLVEIQKEFKINGKIIEKGKYYLKTIMANNTCKIETIDSHKFWLINIKYLIEDGLMKPLEDSLMKSFS